jgi:chromodomain-helicase-DNA-binding protein 4
MANRQQNVDYKTEKDAADAASTAAEDAFEDALTLPSPVKKVNQRRKKRAGSESDTDFQAESEEESEPEPEATATEPIRPEELGAERPRSSTAKDKFTPKSTSTMYKQNGAGAFNKFSSKPTQVPPATVAVKGPKSKIPAQPDSVGNMPSSKATPLPSAPSSSVKSSTSRPATNVPPTVKPFKRAQMPIRSPLESTYGSYSNRQCPACHKQHPTGACELKAAGVEHCGLCGLAHYGHSRTCPHIKSETQVCAMLEALRNSNEPKELVDLASKYLRGVKGTLVQQKKRDREKAAAVRNGTAPAQRQQPVNAGTYVPYVTSGVPNKAPHAHAHAQYMTPFGPLAREIPEREVPAWYQGPNEARQMTTADQMRRLQMQANGQMNEHDMESALRGYLGH